MTENTPDAVRLATDFARRLRANADRAERDKFTVANLSTMSVDGCRALADWIDDAAEFLGARAMQAAMAAPAGVRVRALDLATLLKHAFDSGAKGGAWVDYDCTNLAPYHRVAEACGVPAEYYAAIEDAGAREGIGPLPPDPTPAGAGDLVERLRDASDDPYFQMTPGVEEWLKKNWALREHAADALEALQAEVAAQKARADDMHRRAQQAEAPKMAARDVAKVLWGFISKAHERYHKARARATAAEAARDALKAEVERKDKALRGVREQAARTEEIALALLAQINPHVDLAEGPSQLFFSLRDQIKIHGPAARKAALAPAKAGG